MKLFAMKTSTQRPSSHVQLRPHRWLLDDNSRRCESLADLSHPVVVLQRRERGSDRFIGRLPSDLYGVLDISDIFFRNCARRKNHEPLRCSVPNIRVQFRTFSTRNPRGSSEPSL